MHPYVYTIKYTCTCTGKNKYTHTHMHVGTYIYACTQTSCLIEATTKQCSHSLKIFLVSFSYLF